MRLSAAFARAGLAGLVIALVGSPLACGIDTVPTGDKLTQPGDGPVVKFDLLHRPLPEIPMPNDVATSPDPSSRTGRRINVSLVAPTAMEANLRAALSDMEGWGTSEPITVSFAKSAAQSEGSASRDAALDLSDFGSRMQDSDFDFSDDPLYVVNLTTGLPVFIDAGTGMYPLTLRDSFRYFANDPKASEPNLVFETEEEGPGLTQADYRAALDRDFDGVLDHPNTLGALGIPGVDDALSWYERETDTLILRPVVPLDAQTTYAVVLTDRLRGSNRQPVRSPFETIHHPEQPEVSTRVADVLSDKTRAAYFGDIAGTGLDHVVFAWTFTTAPTTDDLRALRSGLYGQGPFARLATEFPPDATALPAAGKTEDGSAPSAWRSDPSCKARLSEPFILKLSDPDVWATFKSSIAPLLGGTPGELAGLESALANVDHVVVGTFNSPYFLGDPASTSPDGRFHLSFRDGTGDVRSDVVPFFLVVPKATSQHAQPFPVAFHDHGLGGHADEALLYAGDYARQGVATFSYDMPEHGAVLTKGQRDIADAALAGSCLAPFVSAYSTGRAHDYNGDGLADSGWLFWTAHAAHTRDNIRQGVVDGFQAMRVLRAFDGKKESSQDYDGDGKNDLAGDFDGDGTPDVGGPNLPYFTSGESLGAVVSEIAGGAEPYFVASAQEGGGGGALALDVGFRSYGLVASAMEQMLTPLVVALPASERPSVANKEQPGSACAPNQRSVRFVVNEGMRSAEVEIACMEPEDLTSQMTVVVTNVATEEARCARTGQGGRFRVSLPASQLDPIDIQIYAAPDVVSSYDGCQVQTGAPILTGTNARTGMPQKNRIQTFEVAQAEAPFAVSDPSKTCDAAVAAAGLDTSHGSPGCVTFRDLFFPVGSPLVAPNEGLGLARQTPALRRIRDLAQAVLDPADPASFAPFYAEKPLIDENGVAVAPHALLATTTVGDAFVPIAAGHTFARAAGALPFLPPQSITRYPEYGDYVTPQAIYDALAGKTPMRALVEQGATEGDFRLGRTQAGASCRANFVGTDPSVCATANVTSAAGVTRALACDLALSDPDWLSEGAMLFAEPHGTPLRLAKESGVHATDAASLGRAWEPRLRGVPGAPDATAWSATAPVLALLDVYVDPSGAHTWGAPDACKAWDPATYGNNLLARFFSTQGKDVYYLSHPSSHACLAQSSCDFFPKP